MKYYYLEGKCNLNGKYNQICDSLIIQKQSKFIAYLFYIDNEQEALDKIEEIRKDNSQARHIVYIYSYLNNNIANIRFTDDGEPKGTGTKAIYDLIDKEAITNICIVIVRYFGGILLGAGPLSRAYLNSARACIDMCDKKEIYNYIVYSFACMYNDYDVIKNKLESFIQDGFVKINKCDFKEKVYIELKIVDFKLEDIKKVVEEIKYGN